MFSLPRALNSCQFFTLPLQVRLNNEISHVGGTSALLNPHFSQLCYYRKKPTKKVFFLAMIEISSLRTSRGLSIGTGGADMFIFIKFSFTTHNVYLLWVKNHIRQYLIDLLTFLDGEQSGDSMLITLLLIREFS